MKTALGLAVGFVTAFATVYLVEKLGHMIYPPPTSIDYSNPESLREAMAQMPTGALLFVLLAWTSAVLLGGSLAAIIAKKRHYLVAGIIAALILVGAVANMILLPHPVWFVVAGVILIMLAGWAAGALARRLAPMRESTL